MANFPLLRANQAAWVGAVDPSEFWALDRDRSYTINADAGSTHAPSSQIVIGGSGLALTGPNAISGATTLSNVSNLVATACNLTGVSVLTMSAANRVGYTSRSISRQQNLLSGYGDSWTLADDNTPSRPYWGCGVATAVRLWIRLKLPIGSDLTAVKAYLDPGSGHANLPSSTAKLVVYKSAYGVKTVTEIGSEPFSGTLVEYEAGFSLTATVAETIVEGTDYWACVINESGSDAASGLAVWSVETTCDVTEQDEALT